MINGLLGVNGTDEYSSVPVHSYDVSTLGVLGFYNVIMEKDTPYVTCLQSYALH